jgi:UDP-glucose 4-epimerase
MSLLNVAIIGANGFIARALSRELASRPGIKLSLFGRSSPVDLPEGAAFENIDLMDRESLRRQFSKIDVVYYTVSETNPAKSWNDPMSEVDKNLRPFLSFMEAVCDTGIKKVAYISSGGTVYGATEGRVNESHDKKPFAPYGIIKLSIENFLRFYERRNGIQYDVYRVSNVYGEGQDTSRGVGIINTFLESIVRENSVTIYGDGNNTRNFIYIRDVVNLLSFSVKDVASSNIFNVSSDVTLTIRQLVDVMRKAVGNGFTINHTPGRASDNSFIDLDNTAVLSRFPGYRFMPVEEAIRSTYHSIKNKLQNV